MARLFNLTNHTAGEQQIADARRTLGVAECVDLPPRLKKLWGEIPPDTDSVTAFVQPVLDWLGQTVSQADIVWAQGEWGATVCALQWCRGHGIRCVYSTTERSAVEKPLDCGGVAITHQFRHVRFRDYP